MQRIVLAILGLMLATPAALAEVTLPSVISDRMVLQRDQKVRIWGKADPGEGVHVSFHVIGSGVHQKQYVDADKNGDWHIMLEPQRGGVKAQVSIWTSAEVQANANKNEALKRIVIDDVVFGEVWVASGQSNMSWIVADSDNATQEIADSDNDQIRMWTAVRTVSDKPAFDVPGTWAAASPKSTGQFSAVAYYYARHLQKELGVPVGILHTSWGGTPIESWTSTPKLQSIDWAKPILDRYKVAQSNYPKLKKQYTDGIKHWELTRNGPANTGLNQGYAKPDFDDSKWKTMALPQAWGKTELKEKDGVVWFRKKIDLPEGWQGKDLKLELGPIDDGDTTYINATQVGTTAASAVGGWKVDRVYNVPGNQVKKGKMTIAVRVVDLAGEGGLFGKPEQLRLIRADGKGEPVALAGDWRYFLAHEITNENRPVRPPRLPFGPEHPHSPAGLFNAMIHPILPYTIKGAIWYQGESNASRAQQYTKLFPGMIEDWRKQWGQGDFPFIFVQLANYRRATDKVVDPDWAHLRDAQLHTHRTVKNTGMAVTIDIGAARDIHPRNKQDVGLRLARWALADTYGKKDVVKSGPVYSGFAIQDDGKSIGIVMKTFGSELRIRKPDDAKPFQEEPQLQGFTIAGKDGKFYVANASFVLQPDGLADSLVTVWSDQVKDPVAVRYAWEDNPDDANLVNEEGLPASPFRTDDFKGPTDGRR